MGSTGSWSAPRHGPSGVRVAPALDDLQDSVHAAAAEAADHLVSLGRRLPHELQAAAFDAWGWSAHAADPGVLSRLAAAGAAPLVPAALGDIADGESADLMRAVEKGGAVGVGVASGVVVQVHVDLAGITGQAADAAQEVTWEHYYPPSEESSSLFRCRRGRS